MRPLLWISAVCLFLLIVGLAAALGLEPSRIPLAGACGLGLFGVWAVFQSRGPAARRLAVPALVRRTAGARARPTHRPATGLMELLSMSPGEFRDFVAGVFTRAGYLVEVASRLGGSGAFRVRRQDETGIVWCRPYAREALDTNALRSLLSSVDRSRVDVAFVATAAPLTRAAVRFARANNIRLVGRTTLLRGL